MHASILDKRFMIKAIPVADPADRAKFYNETAPLILHGATV